ncbi:hypothetical protein SK44_02375 [Klebsiella aerogenes]|nr:hypothetical protein P851_04515 [Klebsiella aerogenes UCI 48]EUL44217.1 hypothetical protein P850_04607 [Klebsiella aerogenes UCI 47]EUL46788.1 hypothetical protein P849_04007 [Klebsiella aerogenes UCI 46]EUL50557.1 hypothetical protein P848_04378 [Klebsiella aerogenes UCI 45]EUL80550.1 hypothetical protein P830_04101 [Klebsiella aerogenes UCI 27]EUL82852.1 hypothetical protein P831_01123 [Klebsiella aerogenes UCI 28]EUL92583.1 hypothetical protein P819_04263 [Klebsiella aerogenes UCI 16]
MPAFMPDGGINALSGLRSVRPTFNLFTMLAETAGVGGLKIPGGAAAYRGYSAVRFGSPEKAQRAASGKTPGGDWPPSVRSLCHESHNAEEYLRKTSSP